jgi:hypothetical protein
VAGRYRHLPAGREPGPQTRHDFVKRFFRWLLRRNRPKRSKEFELEVAPLEVQRGGSVRARLRLSGRELQRLEVGIECRAHHDVERRTKNGTQTVTEEDTLYEHWVPASTSEPVQQFELTFPAEQAFSYEGTSLSFAWRISAREPRDNRPDERADEPIWVLP